MTTLKASTKRQFQLVADHLHYAARDEAKALEELARKQDDGEEPGAYDLYLKGFTVDTALHHWHHGKTITDTTEPNPQEIDEWIDAGWAIIESRLDAVDVLTTMTNGSITIAETADGYETTITGAGGDEAVEEHITTTIDPRVVPPLLAHLLHGIHRWADQLITGRTTRSL